MDNGVGLHHEASAESLATAHTHRHTRKTKHVTYKEGLIVKKEPSEYDVCVCRQFFRESASDVRLSVLSTAVMSSFLISEPSLI